MRFHITRSDADNNSSNDNDGGQRDQNGAIVGGVFGGVNHGIKGGIFYGTVTVTGDDDEK